MSSLKHRKGARRVQALRKRLEAAVEQAIAALDAFDRDPDLEPALGASVPRLYTDQRYWAEGVTDDREHECEDEGSQCEDEGAADEREPSLCGVTFGVNGTDCELTGPEWDPDQASLINGLACGGGHAL
jgi:hypothetical protein